MNSTQSILIEHVHKSYGKKQALTDVSLEFGQGMTGLLGRNGAGKTTLMKTMVTLLRPTKGTITLCGIPLTKSQEVRKIIGYLPQEFSLYPSMRVGEVLDYLGLLSGMNASKRKERSEILLESLNLQQEYKTKVKALSGGMKRRVGVAQALLHDPKILIADEPTVGLDPEERVRLRELLKEVSKDKIVILSTHIVEDIEASCKEVAILDKGTLKYKGGVANLIEQTRSDCIETAYLRTIQSKEGSHVF